MSQGIPRKILPIHLTCLPQNSFIPLPVFLHEFRMEPQISFFSTLAKNIEQEAFRHNYILKYTFSAFDIDDPFTLRLIASNNIDGIAVLGRCDKELLKFL